ncbi:MAG: hypothetical protein F6J90_37955 [Moorea sp. SIOASIH]|uniref:pentapeptide repeat-containing protein n=1 Tax=Moorena sp. SIOASIH TaxID=2607817 RepID=UPI0013B8162C|nr:pentapeptide repeat-containing protein [Moorena sp. SIOASIH]NEO41801.1 hypothetical protein [Moorena sp. SIOASIH]
MDYSNQNLQGRSFKDKNLESYKFINANLRGADFTGANLAGADFTGAQLQNTNFTDAKAGIPKHWRAMLLIASWLMLGISVNITGLTSLLLVNFITDTDNIENKFTIIISVFFLYIALYIIAFSLDLLIGLAIFVFPGALGMLVGITVTLIHLYIETSFGGGRIIYPGIIFLIIYCAAGGVTFGGMIVEAIVLAMNKAVLPDNNNGVIVGIFGIVATIVIVTTKVTIPVGELGFNIKGAEPGARALIFANIIMLTVTLLGAYIGWRALKGDQKNRWIRSCAIAFASIRGTSFRGANLTNANFTGTTLKSTDFREAILTRTNFNKTKKLDLARAGTTYIQNSQVRQLLITGEGQNKNFDRLDLRYVNLQGAKLENASFIDADFYQANLQGANLSRAILVRTNFERADLRGAKLTGSCIQDWVITGSTKLDGIACDYVYLKWVNGDKRDQMPPRGKFIEGGFVNFVRYMLDTVELYHEKDINPRLALTVLKKMSRDYDQPFDIVALGKKGERVFIQVKVSENLIRFQENRENFKNDYYERYDRGLKLWSGNIHHLPPSVNSFIEKRISEVASEKTDEFAFIDATYVAGDYTENYQGDTTMTGDRHIYQNENSGILQNMSGGTMYCGMQASQENVVSSQQQQSLTEAAEEIQALLKQLEKSYSTEATTGKMALATEVIQRIDSNPTLTAKILSALQVGSVKALEQSLNHPAASFVIGALEDWQKT